MHSLPLRVADLTRWSHAAENFCHALDVVTLLESIVSILLLTQKRYIAFSLEDGHPWFYHGRRKPLSQFTLSAIGTSTDPHRASLVIAGSDQMRFSISIIPHLHACVIDRQRSGYSVVQEAERNLPCCSGWTRGVKLIVFLVTI